MKKPYEKIMTEVSGITVWMVDGYYVRQNIDINFNNFGQHYRFNFIPKNEFWIDKQANPGKEEGYFVEHLLIEHKLMSEGVDYNNALEQGNHVEQEMRERDKEVWRLKEELNRDKESVLKIVRKKILKQYSNKKIKTYVIDSFLVRSLFYLDWVAGGHDEVYPAFVPKNEIWIDNDITARERKYVLLHELHERYWMTQGWTYDKAHESALEIEAHCHKNPEDLAEKIKEELDRQV